VRGAARRRRWAALFVIALFLSGCWDRRELEERSNVLAAGVDLCEDEENECLVVSRQIAIPGQIPLGSASPSAGRGEAVVVISTPGKDGPDSARRAQMELNRSVTFGHTREIVFSEAFARRGLADYLDYVRRVPEARRLMWVAIAEGRAETVIRARPSLELVPALYLNDMIDNAVKAGRLPEIFIGEFMTRLANKGEEAIAPLVRMVGQDHPQIVGLAVFRGSHMVGKLSGEEMVTYMELRGNRRGSELLEVKLSGDKKAYLAVYGRGTKYQTRWAGGHIDVTIKIDLETDILQLAFSLDSSDPKVIAMLETRAGQEVAQRADALLAKLQGEFDADILGLGERVRAHMPRVWERIDDWPAAFVKARFHTEVQVHIRRTGLAKN
jgi:spore germination protein KC